MATPFSASDLVSLPRVSAGELLSLLRQLETEANARQAELPPYVLKARDRISITRADLEGAYGAIPQAPGKKAADHKMDNAWRAFERFISATTLLQPHHSPGPKEGKQIYDLIFGAAGLSFITFVNEIEYEETKKRLDLLEKSNLIGDISVLGAKPFIDDLQSAFAEYGEALHITTARPQEAPSIRPHWEKALEAVRQYVTKVVSLEDPDEPNTLDQIKALLQPLKDWEDKLNAQRQATTPVAPTTPTAPSTDPSTPDSNP